MYSIGDNALYIRIMERRAGFVTGLEIEHLSGIAQIRHAGTEDISVLIPCTENQLGRLGNKERLGVQFLALNKKALRNTLGNWVSGKQIPHYFTLIASPRQVAGRTDDSTERLGVMSRVKRNKAHVSQQNAALYTCHQLVIDFAMSHMPPPDQHIGVVQDFGRSP